MPDDAKPTAKGKLEGEAITRHSPVTAALWARHLRGDKSFGLGIVPIRDDSTCSWGAIDVDVYPLDLPPLNAEVARLGLPLVTCRTKSGGAHLFLFMHEPVAAEVVRTQLMEWAIVLGYPGVEVFPKQTRLASEKDDGSWLNMPYQSGTRTTRYALGSDGSSLTPEEFIALANSICVTVEELRAIELPEELRLDDFLVGAPPCLETLARSGFPEGTRNNALFNIAIYLKKRYGDDWVPYLQDYNERFMDPPLGSKDVNQIAKSVNKKSYGYKCKDQPISGACNRQICLTRDFGVGGNSGDPGVVFGDLLKLETEPPVWIWDVNGARLELETDDMMDQRRLHKLVINTLNIWPTMIKAPAWQEIVRAKMAAVQVIEAPRDATQEGQLWIHLQNFCTSKVKGKSLDEILMGKPFTENGRSNFRSADFLAHLQKERVSGVNAKSLYQWLRREGVQHHFSLIKGKGVNHWSVPAFDEQTEDFEVPRKTVEEM